jgi:Long-chain acyl-CoA synthetases (AMP-forming)
VDIRTSGEGGMPVLSPCDVIEYYLVPDKTAEVFTGGGFLCTGDKGVLDCDGYVKITGRLKDIFITAKGKYVTPAPFDALFMEIPLVEPVCVTGTNLPPPVALLVLCDGALNKDKSAVEACL